MAGQTRFDHWEGDVPVGLERNSTITVTMDGDKELMAVFVRLYSLEATTIGSGTVSPSSGTYDQGTEVAVTAMPAARLYLGRIIRR